MQHELARAEVFLETMGYKARTEVRNVDINLSYQEAKEYGRIFRQFDKDKDGHISIHDLRKALHVCSVCLYNTYWSRERERERERRVEFVDSNQASANRVRVCQAQLVYISPEQLLQNLQWQEMLRSDVYQQNLAAFIIDEAHTVSKW